MTDDDLRARLRAVEDIVRRHGEDIAGLKSDVRGIDRTVEAFAPSLKEMNDTKETANRALSKAQELEDDRDEDRTTARFTKWQLITVAVSISALLVSLSGLVFLILTFAGAAHG